MGRSYGKEAKICKYDLYTLLACTEFEDSKKNWNHQLNESSFASNKDCVQIEMTQFVLAIFIIIIFFTIPGH